MDYILSKYCPRIEFDSYEDFYDNFKIDVPENFNFAYDVVDEWARVEPDKKALVWINDAGEEREFTFTDISLLSNRAANAFKKLGIRKGDVVMMMLRRRWEYWVCAMALCKIGASIIPATIQLTSKDIAYRANSAAVKMLICVDDDYVVEQVEGALPNSPSIQEKVLVAGNRDGWLSFDELIEDESDEASSNDFGKNIIPKMLQNGEKMAAYRFSGYWKDVGTLDSLWDANMDMLATGSGLDLLEKDWPIYGVSAPPAYLGVNAHVEHSVVARGCTVEGEAENSVLSERCTVEEGASVQYCILMPGAVVKKDARVSYAIIGEGCRIGENAVVGGAPGSVDFDHWGIAVVGPHAQVRDGQVIQPNMMLGEDGKEVRR